jgi:hypothetical protein
MKWGHTAKCVSRFPLDTHFKDKHTREVPRNQRNSNTNRLLDRKHPSTRCSRHLNRSLHTLGLASEPPSEAQSIVELALRLRKRLASLVSYNVGQVVAVLADQRVPFEQALGAGPGADFAKGLEGFVGGGDGCVGVFGDVVGGCCPYFAVAWVCFGAVVSWLGWCGYGLGGSSPTTSKRLPDFASTHSPLTRDLSLNKSGLLSCRNACQLLVLVVVGDRNIFWFTLKGRLGAILDNCVFACTDRYFLRVVPLIGE